MFGRSRLRKEKMRTVTKWRRVFARVLIFFIVFTPLAVLSYGFWYVTHLPSLTLSEIQVAEGETVSPRTIEKVVNEELTGNYFRFIPKRFAWFYPEEKIIERIKTVPRVKDVTVERTDGHILSISFNEYDPYALWCARPVSGTLDNCFFIDNEGIAFAAAPPLSGSALLRYVDEKQDPELKQKLFSYDWLKLSEEFAHGIKEHFDFTVIYLERVNENEIFYHLGSGGVVKIGSEKSAETTLNDLETVFSDSQFSHLRSGNFVHIDLRYGNKVFVKEKEVEPEPTVAEEDVVE